ncbi:MAG: hypothetical protein IJ344_04425, partial [Clostridia bacterium]|nr:hypothetical protein [Clostridia bacterium]
TYQMLRKNDRSATDAVLRLRLYITVSGYKKTLRDLFFEGGFTAKEYDDLLFRYNKELSKGFS